MLKSTYLILIAGLSLFMAVCNRPSANQQNNTPVSRTDSLHTEALINRAKASLSSNTDSVWMVAQQLKHLGMAGNNKAALVYAQLYEANYYWIIANYQQAVPVALHALSDA